MSTAVRLKPSWFHLPDGMPMWKTVVPIFVGNGFSIRLNSPKPNHLHSSAKDRCELIWRLPGWLAKILWCVQRQPTLHQPVQLEKAVSVLALAEGGSPNLSFVQQGWVYRKDEQSPPAGTWTTGIGKLLRGAREQTWSYYVRFAHWWT